MSGVDGVSEGGSTSDRVATGSDPTVAQAVVDAVGVGGTEIAQDPGRVRAMVNDVLGSRARAHRAHVDAVVIAAEEGVGSDLLGGSATGELVDRVRARGIDDAVARFAVSVWEFALVPGAPDPGDPPISDARSSDPASDPVSDPAGDVTSATVVPPPQTSGAAAPGESVVVDAPSRPEATPSTGDAVPAPAGATAAATGVAAGGTSETEPWWKHRQVVFTILGVGAAVLVAIVLVVVLLGGDDGDSGGGAGSTGAEAFPFAYSVDSVEFSHEDFEREVEALTSSPAFVEAFNSSAAGAALAGSDALDGDGEITDDFRAWWLEEVIDMEMRAAMVRADGITVADTDRESAQNELLDFALYDVDTRAAWEELPEWLQDLLIERRAIYWAVVGAVDSELIADRYAAIEVDVDPRYGRISRVGGMVYLDPPVG